MQGRNKNANPKAQSRTQKQKKTKENYLLLMDTKSNVVYNYVLSCMNNIKEKCDLNADLQYHMNYEFFGRRNMLGSINRYHS